MTLKEMRLAAGLTQKEVAKAMHTDQCIVSQWETGAFRPKPYRWAILAELYHVTKKDIWEALENME